MEDVDVELSKVVLVQTLSFGVIIIIIIYKGVHWFPPRMVEEVSWSFRKFHFGPPLRPLPVCLSLSPSRLVAWTILRIQVRRIIRLARFSALDNLTIDVTERALTSMEIILRFEWYLYSILCRKDKKGSRLPSVEKQPTRLEPVPQNSTKERAFNNHRPKPTCVGGSELVLWSIALKDFWRDSKRQPKPRSSGFFLLLDIISS